MPTNAVASWLSGQVTICLINNFIITGRQIELILSIEPNTLKNAILKGQLQAEAEIRQVVVNQAKSGSGEAQRIIQGWMSRIRFENIKNT